MIKAGDYLYCHSDCWHNENRFLYDTETTLVFKAGNKYLVEDISDFEKGDPYMALYAEDGTLYLVSYHGKDEISCHRKRFWTMDELREKKLSDIFN